MSLLGKMIKTHGADKNQREKNLKLQDKRLRDLVDYARTHSPFYKELY